MIRGVGWRGRIRTFNPLIQNQVPYRLATRQRRGGILPRTFSVVEDCRPATYFSGAAAIAWAIAVSQITTA